MHVEPITLLVVAVATLVGLFALIVAVELLGRKCPECGSRKTFTWTDVTPDASFGSHTMHKNINRYCFKCCDFTMRDDFALMYGMLDSRITYKLAARHYRKHHKKDDASG